MAHDGCPFRLHGACESTSVAETNEQPAPPHQLLALVYCAPNTLRLQCCACPLALHLCRSP
ncbi:hypothetical protein AG1IA_02164 [Rhizoctonia solani AG-1 IA]|uniref:Uncharacterized protein n=1 Tax=Thanatephorus cucumeris (strain AG1-IA) TaxID=983506 RepID=L8X5B0_THACA|nr:hypothetical protein AG1IA_02164 [Rhizoctonia solani AG-1 IA]